VTGTDAGARTGSIEVDQFVDAEPARVWQTITDPQLLARWWAPGDIAPRVGHRFSLDVPGWGAVPCEVLEVVEHERLVHTFNGTWTLTWRLVPEGRGTRLLLSTPASTSGRSGTGTRSTGWAPAGATSSCRGWPRSPRSPGPGRHGTSPTRPDIRQAGPVQRLAPSGRGVRRTGSFNR
jgi:uncharacterized protein YndB with AHSA1/START domain